MSKIKDYIMSQHTDDTDYETSVAYRFVRGIEEQIGAPGSLGSEDLMDDDGAEIDPDSGDNYPEGWDEGDFNY